MQRCDACGCAISDGLEVRVGSIPYHMECYETERDQMSMRDKLFRVATEAAQEATNKETTRVLWCLDGILERLEEDLNKKVLIEQQRHVAEIKLNIAKAVVTELRTMIIMRAGPPEEKKDD